MAMAQALELSAAPAAYLNKYSYMQKDCHVVLLFLNDEVKVNVTGPRGKYCVDDDLGGGCGMNASVETAIYKKVKKKQP